MPRPEKDWEAPLPNPTVKDEEEERPAWVDKGFGIAAFLVVLAIGLGFAALFIALVIKAVQWIFGL